MDIIFLIITAIYILFCPGLLITFVLFDFKKIDHLERFALAIILSITVVPVLTFFANLVGFSITSGLVIFEVILISEISFVAYFIKHQKG